jgi:hypothetical protein
VAELERHRENSRESDVREPDTEVFTRAPLYVVRTPVPVYLPCEDTDRADAGLTAREATRRSPSCLAA